MKLKDKVYTMEEFMYLIRQDGKDAPHPSQISKPQLGKKVQAGGVRPLRSLHLHKVSPPEGCIFLAQEEDLVLFAKEVLRALDPSPMEQVLEVLKDVERKLPEPPLL